MRIEKKEAVKIGVRIGDLKCGEPFLKDGCYFMKTDELSPGSEGDHIGCVDLATGDLFYLPEATTASPIIAKIVVE